MALVILASALVLVAQWLATPEATMQAPVQTPAKAAARAVPVADPRGPYSAAGLQARRSHRALWQERLERSEDTLDAYRRSTRYPPTSQPLAARADQAYPNQAIADAQAFYRSDGSAVEGLTLHTTQQRVYVAGAENVSFTLSLSDKAGRPLPLRVLHARAREITAPSVGSLYPEVPVDFNDDGSGADATSGDATFSAQLQPSTQGFGGLSGPLRVEAQLQHADQLGHVAFDMVYTSVSPADWQGPVREALEDGSLSFYLGARVRQAGRYVVTARVDDANGVPFALLGFNEEVAAGAQEFRLTLFGKLLRDARPDFPLTLRDVEAFVLQADVYPDRSLMPRLEGEVHRSASYPLAGFAPAEWSSEERTRHLEEFSRDVDEARAALQRLGP